ncbi:hypothetical protein BURC_03227 [Burkholderiaceae bacterium]|nr:hypothetical protein BURC_03227 [Burkholderiaceae bacterium]
MKRLAALLLAFSTAAAAGAPVALSDDELAGVSGQDGIGIAVHLELNSSVLDGVPSDSRLTLGFKVDGVTTYAVLHNLAGVVDLFALSLDVRSRADGGGDYVDIGLPGFIAFREFGFRALAAQTDPHAPIAPSASYGQLLLNGTGAMTGHVYLWGHQ